MDLIVLDSHPEPIDILIAHEEHHLGMQKWGDSEPVWGLFDPNYDEYLAFCVSLDANSGELEAKEADFDPISDVQAHMFPRACALASHPAAQFEDEYDWDPWVEYWGTADGVDIDDYVSSSRDAVMRAVATVPTGVEDNLLLKAPAHLRSRMPMLSKGELQCKRIGHKTARSMRGYASKITRAFRREQNLALKTFAQEQGFVN